jgi:hypothetical protein
MTTRPVQQATFMILTALADGAQHGYGIISEVADISGGRRPSLMEAADLLRMRLGLVGCPRTVLYAVRLMYLGALAQFGVLVIVAVNYRANEVVTICSDAAPAWRSCTGCPITVGHSRTVSRL